MNIMDFCKSKQRFLPGSEHSSAHTPPSSSPSKSPNQVRRRTKAPSESIAHDLLVQRTMLAVPGSAAPGYAAENNNRYRYRGTHRATAAEGEESTEEEEEEDYDSFQLSGYPELATKDRFKSASLEWTTGANGVITPRASHYNTHPPLDFKSLKEKLKKLIGSPHETNRKQFAAYSYSSSSSSYSGLDERKTGGISGLHSVPFVTSPSADMMRCSEMLAGNRATSAEILQNVSNTKNEGVKNVAKDSHSLERSNRVLWKDLALHVAETDKTLQKILYRHSKELEDLKKKHEEQWIQLKSQIAKSKGVQHLGREPMLLNSEARYSQTLSRSKSDVQLTALGAAAAMKTQDRITSKSALSETGSKECMTNKHNDKDPVIADFTDSCYRYKDMHARQAVNAQPKENCPLAQRDANCPATLVNSHSTCSLYPTVSGMAQLTRPVDAHCVSPMNQRQSELETAKQLENQLAALITQRIINQQLTNLDLAAKIQRPSLGTGFYALPNGCYQYPCMPTLQQLQSPTAFTAMPIYQETICHHPPPPPTNTFPGAGTFPWNRTEFLPQRIGSRTPCREFVQHHQVVPGNVQPDPARQFLCNGPVDQLPSEIRRINAYSFAPSQFVLKAQPPAPQLPCFDNNYPNGGYNFPCFVNPFPSVPMSFLHPSMQYPNPDFKDIHQTFIPLPTDHQPYLTWS